LIVNIISASPSLRATKCLRNDCVSVNALGLIINVTILLGE